VYKPVAGERPLWDFPDGTLAGREVAAYAVSEATGWDVVPPTVMREGPFGPGMVQLWIDTVDDDSHALVDVMAPTALPSGWLRVLDALGSGGEPVVLAHADDERLRRMTVLDVVLNNADRKGGHVLYAPDGRIHGVDHGVCFHVENKLRTVLWGWTGKTIPADSVEVLSKLSEQLDSTLGAALEEHLTLTEVQHARLRVHRLRRAARFPKPPQDWPAVPWPPV
jgi:uncharacterized repeat protein (TIGR03843 family)